jgi:surface antigen
MSHFHFWPSFRAYLAEPRRLLGCSLLALALGTSACTMNREQTGTVLGGAAGAAAGSAIGSGSGRTAATIVGGLIGAFAGRSVGQHMDQQDRMQTAMAMENNATGKSSTWTNPDSGTAYSVTPTRTYDSGGAPCREFTMAATVDGKPDEIRGTACRQADGNWKIIES